MNDMATPPDDSEDLINFKFTLVPAFAPEYLHENIRSALARDLPEVRPCKAHGHTLSIAGGGPSLGETYRDLSGQIAAINGSLAFLLDKGVVPHLCGVCDPSEHIADLVAADPRVTYFIASCAHPKVFDKLLNAGCHVVRWNVSSIPGGEAVYGESGREFHVIGGGSTMGLRWLTLGYTCGFRIFGLHGFDSSCRTAPDGTRSSHAYPDHQDGKAWIVFDGYQTRLNFVAQVADFCGWMDRLREDDVDPIKITVHGDGLLQSYWRKWKERNPGAHEVAIAC